MNDANKLQAVKILPPEEARRIAAGEVIDRPNALVREFLDNAIDSGAVNIEVSIEEGGSKKIEVSDDGGGMTRSDLELCHLPHATSKIRGLNDLDTSRTLGFRGEALAAISAVSRLEIITSIDGREAFKLTTGPGESYAPSIEQTRRIKGTTARALNLFENIPARKRFLKRAGSEAALCRQIFIDKALAFNNINFRYLQDGVLKDYLPSVSTKKERFASAVFQTSAGDFSGSSQGTQEKNFLYEIYVNGEGFTVTVVIGGPELFRNDRRQIYIFVNGRRVQEYALVQAVEYGCQGWFPNGTHPVSAVYAEIDPSLADFNIHPAKREVRFRDPGAIHSAISGGVKNFYHNLYLKNSHNSAQARSKYEVKNEEFIFKNEKNNLTKNDNSHSPFISSVSEFSVPDLSSISRKLGEINSTVRETAPAYGEIRYAGRAFGLFILIEYGDRLYIIDQHAAHERILYNKFLNEGIPKQELLTPVPFQTESADDDAFLEEKQNELSRLGIEIKKDENSPHGFWHIEALPAGWRMNDKDTLKEILSLRTAGENMAQRWAATLCCHAAVKDGDYPDNETALDLGRQALSLSEPRCPHGRPVWTEISRDALYKAVRRD